MWHEWYGAFCILTPIYIAEIADQNSRERLLMYFQLLINCGIMYAFVFAYLLNEHDSIWRYLLLMLRLVLVNIKFLSK